MITICKEFKFSAAHKLPYYDGKCKELHGHGFKLQIEVTGDIIKEGPKQGMIIDFGDLKKIINEIVIERLDHKFLNLYMGNPTAENLIKDIGKKLPCYLPDGIKLIEIRLWETDTSFARWTNESL